MAAHELPMAEVMRSVTMELRLTGVRVFRARLSVGMMLLRLAARVMGCGIEVLVEPIQASKSKDEPTARPVQE